MSYDVHIIKSEQWYMSNQQPITESELSLVLKHLRGLPVLYQDGRLTLCGANKPAIEVLIVAANKIGAKVQGDEGEYYDYEVDEAKIELEMAEEESPVVIPEDSQLFIERLSVGDRIMHRKFGAGTIEKMEGAGTDLELMVYFDAVNKIKRILAYFAPIYASE